MISINKTFDASQLPDNEPLFEVGQLVRHRRYGYRGVVVASDGRCCADPTWYMSNQTQPDRGQPWYHVLVHGSNSVTYAAQSSLQVDESRDPVDHALVEHFFSSFRNGRYVRNSEPWPGQDHEQQPDVVE